MENDGLRVWKSLTIGPGKLLPWDTFKAPKAAITKLKLKALDAFDLDHTRRKLEETGSEQEESAAEQKHIEAVSTESTDETAEGDRDEDPDVAEYFPSKEPGCTSGFLTFSRFCRHMTSGKHTLCHMTEETLADLVKKPWICDLSLMESSRKLSVEVASEAALADTLSTAIDEIHTTVFSTGVRARYTNCTGWALQQQRKGERYPAHVVTWLVKNFKSTDNP